MLPFGKQPPFNAVTTTWLAWIVLIASLPSQIAPSASGRAVIAMPGQGFSSVDLKKWAPRSTFG